jgi:replicative DNA helicase
MNNTPAFVEDRMKQAVEELRKTIPLTPYLGAPSRKNKLRICPACSEHPEDANEAGTVVVTGKTWKCSRCGMEGDVLTAIALQTGKEYDEILREQAEVRGVTLPVNLLDYYKESRPRLQTDAPLTFLQTHGLSIGAASAQWMGFDPESALPAGGNAPRVLLPCNEYYFVSWNAQTGERIPDHKNLVPDLFNTKALFAAEAVFVTDNPLDALSIMETGAGAVGLPGIDKRRDMALLLREIDRGIKAGRRIAPIVIATTLSGELARELKRRNIRHVSCDLRSGGKYASGNEHLVEDRSGFIDAVKRAKMSAQERPDNVSDYIDNIMALDADRFKAAVETGFQTLDEQTGGLYAGLYVIAAISSLGKTTLTLQLAEQIAQRGQDVLFFSLEQSRLELVSKGIARRTAGPGGIKRNAAVSSMLIRRGMRGTSELQRAQVELATQAYKLELQNRFSIIEGNFGMGGDEIAGYVQDYIQNTGKRPVVIIDYLQVLTPPKELRVPTTKDAIDATVKRLKTLSRDEELTMIVICSVNRANYLTPIAFESRKESGTIEYTADVVLGMQLQCLREPLFEQEKGIVEKRKRIEEEKDATPRRVELRSLKNRYGGKISVNFDYYPACDLIIDRGGPQEVVDL